MVEFKACQAVIMNYFHAGMEGGGSRCGTTWSNERSGTRKAFPDGNCGLAVKALKQT